MSDRLVLVDSSVWVNYLSASAGKAELLAGLLRAHRVATNDIIRMEILVGARNEAQYRNLSDQWEGLNHLPITPAVWRRAERLRYELNRKGHLIPLPDALIASSAIAYDCELLHADRHYDQIAKISPIKVARS